MQRRATLLPLTRSCVHTECECCNITLQLPRLRPRAFENRVCLAASRSLHDCSICVWTAALSRSPLVQKTPPFARKWIVAFKSGGSQDRVQVLLVSRPPATELQQVMSSPPHRGGHACSRSMYRQALAKVMHGFGAGRGGPLRRVRVGVRNRCSSEGMGFEDLGWSMGHARGFLDRRVGVAWGHRKVHMTRAGRREGCVCVWTRVGGFVGFAARAGKPCWRWQEPAFPSAEPRAAGPATAARQKGRARRRAPGEPETGARRCRGRARAGVRQGARRVTGRSSSSGGGRPRCRRRRRRPPRARRPRPAGT